MQYVERYHSNLKIFYLCAGFSNNGWSTQKCTSAQQIYYPTHQNAHLFFVTSYPHTPKGLPLPPPYVYTYANIILENDYKQLTIFRATKYTWKRTYLHKTYYWTCRVLWTVLCASSRMHARFILISMHSLPSTSWTGNHSFGFTSTK